MMSRRSTLAVAALAAAGFAIAVLAPSRFPGRILSQSRELYREMKWEAAALGYAAWHTSKPCPADAITILALGQSNAANSLGAPEAARPELAAFSFFRGRCYPIGDPLPGSSGSGGSLWTRLAHRLAERTTRPILVVDGAHGGTTVADWLARHPGHTVRAAEAVRQLRRRVSGPVLAFWLQGEADALAATGQEAYAIALKQVIATITKAADEGGSHAQPEARLQWRIAIQSRCGSMTAANDAVRAAQLATIDPLRGILAGPDLDRLDEVYRSDGCHFNAAGRERVIELLLQALESWETGEPPSPVLPRRTTIPTKP